MNAKEYKDIYAKEKGYRSWAALRNAFSMDGFLMSVHEDKCMESYHKQNLKEILPNILRSFIYTIPGYEELHPSDGEKIVKHFLKLQEIKEA